MATSADRSLDIYLLGICGTGVGALAGMLQQLGHRVRGSDAAIYPPMSTKLREWGIPVYDGYNVNNMAPAPDLVIVGNVIRRDNPEAALARAQGWPTLSMPQAVAELGIADRHSIVVAGTHGKTTITALIAHVLLDTGHDPSFLIGGIPTAYGESFRVGRGAHFVVEGDEYDTAYFDKGPKFLHYRARTGIITSLEYDHADIFDSIEAVERAFAAFVQTVPATDGHLVVWAGAERARAMLRRDARGPRVTIYSTTERSDADLWLRVCDRDAAGLALEPVWRGRSLGRMRVPMWGEHGAGNALAAIGALCGVGISATDVARGLASFQGVKRRLEVIGRPGGIDVVDDFAHHPTAVAVTLQAARQRWPGRRLWAIFEPRSATTRRNVFQSAFAAAFAEADEIVVGSHERLLEIDPAQRFDPAALAAALRAAGRGAIFEADVDRIVTDVTRRARRGDVILILSNGAFGGLHDKLLRSLAATEHPPQ